MTVKWIGVCVCVKSETLIETLEQFGVANVSQEHQCLGPFCVECVFICFGEVIERYYSVIQGA